MKDTTQATKQVSRALTLDETKLPPLADLHPYHRHRFEAEQSHMQYLKIMLSRSNGYSMMPVVGARARKISCSVGR